MTNSNGYYNYGGYYGGGYQPYAPDPYAGQRYAEKKDIKFISNVVGGCVIGYVIVQNILGIIIGLIPKVRDAYFSDPGFQSALGAILSIVGVMLPFLIGGVVLSRRGKVEIMCFGKPKSIALMLLLVPVGFIFCMIANTATNVLTSMIESLGFTLDGGDFAAPDNPGGRIIFFIEIAVCAPLCEEMAVRGAVMQPLRKYGDRFAILASATVFAVMHGNLVQAPFAFLAGIALGYIVCVTESIWAGVLLHFANNAFSVVIDFLIADVSDITEQNIIYYTIIGAMAAIAAACLVVIITKYRGQLKITSKLGCLKSREKLKAFIVTVPMIIALLMMLFITAEYVSWSPEGLVNH